MVRAVEIEEGEGVSFSNIWDAIGTKTFPSNDLLLFFDPKIFRHSNGPG